MPDGWIKAIKVFGFPTVVAVVLLGVLVVDVRGKQDIFQEQHTAIVTEQQNLARGVLKLADKQGETQMLQEKILSVLKQMCIQAANNAQERRDCLREQ